MAQHMLQRTLRDLLQETEDAISSGRIDTALANCQAILASFPESLEAQRMLGEVYLAQGRLEEALQSFDWVLTNDPENVLAYCNRALVSERMSDYDTALDCYQQAYELSRGNRQIRQEFNQLSAKAGQQGFMFSRAGLARLYMRGDLLSQAQQEWETVLAATPDRLDARLGLLETYWRDGFVEGVERLGAQILQDVPGCVKALLLLAHVTFPKDPARAQELLLRAGSLDPDLVMAQELFADHMASKPDDPFLQSLRKSPAVVEGMASGAMSKPADISGAGASDTLSQWGSGASWSGDTALVKPGGENSSGSYDGQPANWLPDGAGTNAQQASSSGVMPVAQSASNPISISSWDFQVPPQPTQSGEPEPWQLLQEALNDMPNPASLLIPDEQVADVSAPAPLLQPSEALQYPEADQKQKEVGNISQPVSEQGSVYQQKPNISIPGADEQRGSSPDNQPTMTASSPSWGAPIADEVAESAPLSSVWETPGATEDKSQGMPSSPSWDLTTDDDKALSPPAWLSMLTQDDRRQMSTAMPAISPSASQSPADASSPDILSWEEQIKAPSSTESEGEGEEDLPFGPAWLKSLGAATLDDETAAAASSQHAVVNLDQPASATQPPELVQSSTFEAWNDDVQETVQAPPQADEAWQAPSTPALSTDTGVRETPATYVPWQETPASPDSGQAVWQEPQAEPDPVQPGAFEAWKPLESPGSPEDAQASALLTTMEELEQQLRSQGFTPLAPNSLAALAQAEEQEKTPDAVEAPQEEVLPPPVAEQPFWAEPARSPEPVAEQPFWAEPMRSPEPVAEQPFWPEPARSPAPLAEMDMPPQSSFGNGLAGEPGTPGVAPLGGPQEPQWLRELRSTPTSVPDAGIEETVQQPLSASNRRNGAESVPPPVAQKQPPAMAPVSEKSEAPALRNNPFLDGGLETTMKRPAVRLQSLQRPAQIHEVLASLPAKTRPVERKEPAGKGVDGGSLSYRDRLLKGYQHQLVGDYDEAMQEYRIIIRSAPELLGEVVSNVRALLKIAPRYSAGYRVLGDAYMRQGEYLQAMEAYNKALTMAKKGKS